MSEAHGELKGLLDELRALAEESGAPSLAELVGREAQAFFPGGTAAPLPAEQPAAVALMAAAALRAGLAARRAAVGLEPTEAQRKLERYRVAQSDGSHAAEHVGEGLQRIKAKLKGDIARFNDDLGAELPLVVQRATIDDLKRHFPAFVEHVFSHWLHAELAEIEQELAELAERTEAITRAADSGLSRPSILPELGTRAL